MRISAKLNDNREFRGRVIGTDPSTDLALIKIESDDDLPTIPGWRFRNTESRRVGTRRRKPLQSELYSDSRYRKCKARTFGSIQWRY